MGKQSQIVIFRVVSGRPNLGRCLRLQDCLGFRLTYYVVGLKDTARYVKRICRVLLWIVGRGLYVEVMA